MAVHGGDASAHDASRTPERLPAKDPIVVGARNPCWLRHRREVARPGHHQQAAIRQLLADVLHGLQRYGEVLFTVDEQGG